MRIKLILFLISALAGFNQIAYAEDMATSAVREGIHAAFTDLEKNIIKEYFSEYVRYVEHDDENKNPYDKSSKKKKKSKDKPLPPTNRHLVELVTKRPESRTAMAAIDAIGPKKVERYAAAVLALLHGTDSKVATKGVGELSEPTECKEPEEVQPEAAATPDVGDGDKETPAVAAAASATLADAQA